MTEAEERLAADRANRNAARQLVEGHVAQIKADLAARTIREEIAAIGAFLGRVLAPASSGR